MGTAARIVLQAFAITLAAALVAIAADLLRPGGIPLVADAPYEIFAPCRDSEARTRAASAADLAGRGDVLYVDARSAEEFAAEHVEGAVSAPYSVLFGAAAGDVGAVKAEAARRKASRVVVYGAAAAPDASGKEVDLAQPLAAQLSESGVAGVGHAEGGLAAMKKSGLHTVEKGGGIMTAREWIREGIGLGLRAALAITFAWACLHKIADPRDFALQVATYQILPLGLVNLQAIVLPWVELVAAALLALGLLTRPAALVTCGMNAMFIAAISMALAADLHLQCGCFASSSAGEEMSAWLIVRDAVLLLAGAYLTVAAPGRLSLDRALARRRNDGKTR